MILNVFGQVTRTWCNVTLGLLNLLLNTVHSVQHSPGASPTETEEYTEQKYIPNDIRSVREKFDLEPSTTTHATCVRCCCTYPPILKKKMSTYPERCTFKKYRGSKPCGQLLVKTRRNRTTKSTIPIRPFVVQDYNDFLAGLLSRPGLESAIERGTKLNDKHQLWDIKDGTGMSEIMGPDGKVFMDGLQRSDLRLAWSLSVDWFNPHGNKTSGKKKSVGSIAMALLNLPPSIRYKAENLYVVGVIPGPREPSLDEINHFLRPLVNFFLPAWQKGTWFTKTVEHPEGRLAKSVIAVAVNDLPAARKVGGFAGPNSEHLCHLCWVRRSGKGNIAYETWQSRTYQEHLEAAMRWRDAETKTHQNKIFKETGVRWSELLRLPYWNPTRFLVIDGMHNLFLGLVQHHFRDLIVVDKLANQELRRSSKPAAKPATTHELEKARLLVESGATMAALNRIRVPVLLTLVEERGRTNAIGSATGKKRTLKKDLINALLVSVLYDDGMTGA